MLFLVQDREKVPLRGRDRLYQAAQGIIDPDDPTLANREMGWKATRTVEETLKAAWAWEKHLAGK